MGVQHDDIDHTGITGVGGALTVQEEGSPLSTAATTLNFTGSLVTASGSGATKTIDVPGLTSAQADCTASVTLTADTIADVTGCSLTLSVAGTYLLMAQAIFTATTSARDYTLAAITTSANAKVSEVRGGVTNAMPESLFLAAIVTIGSSTTYKLRGQSSRTNNTVTRYGSGTDIGTRLISVRIA